MASLTIAQENQLPGTPESVWDNIDGIGDPAIQGYATSMSVDVGKTESFKINDTAKVAYHIDIYRLGYYQGNGARLVATIPSSPTQVQAQPSPLYDSSTGMYDAGNWEVSASWAVPSDATSGVYIADVVRNDTGGMSQIVFVVRNDASHSDILFKTSDATWQAYNDWGGTGPDSSGIWRGNSLYTGTFNAFAGAAYAVSYNRPLNNRENTSVTNIHDQFFYAEYPMVRWLEANGYDVSYFTDVDADQSGSLLKNHKIDLSVGHDEYWSAGEYNNFMAARDAGVNLAFFSGNEVFWKTRWANSFDPSHTAYRTLVDYKETHANAQIDPLDTSPTWTWTGTKEDPRFSPPADGGIDQNQLTGTFFTVNQGVDATGTPIAVPGTDANLRFWRNTAIAQLAPNQPPMTIGGQVLGYEWDEDVDGGFRPAGLMDLSSTTQDVNGPGGQSLQRFVDYGNTVLPKTATHSLTLYRASSGALVFGAGTVQWSWGLDSDHDVPDNLPDPDVNMQQATVNLFADMGNVQPATLRPGLVAATASTDTTPPTSVITSPTAGAALQCGTPVTIAGTATDAGGGRVAGVEVSVDDGQTWHPAQGRANWTYTWTTGAPGPVTIRSRAVDDSGNLETPSAGVPVTVSQPSGPLSIWSATTTPSVVDAPDSAAVELGVRFRSDISGFITGVRFYKGPTNTGTHVGNLWDSAGNLLATATFSGETASGWQQVNFDTPVAITAGTIYIASYHTNVGNYAIDVGGFTAWSRQNANADNGPLHALTDIIGSRNGVYQYGPGGFPNNISPDSSNYGVDVVFATAANVPPTVTGETPVPHAEGVPTNTTPTATFSESVQSSSIKFVLTDPSGNTVPATVSYNDTTHTATLMPSPPLNSATTYTATVSGATDASGRTMTGPVTWSFSTTGLSSLWSESVTPTVASANDPGAVELGVKFRTDVAGYITGIRFYKGPSNTGTHVGHLWTDSGTLLTTATFTNETASGWQQVNFDTPVAIQPNTTYVASYYAPQGGYADDTNYFATSGYGNAPLHALADGVDGADGVFAYGSGNTFPTGSYQSPNYWVDVVFTNPAATYLNVSAPASATAGAPFNVTVTAQSASNNTAPGYTGTVHFTSSDAAAGLPADYTFTAADEGVHTFTGVTLKTTGSQAITATDTATASITGSATVTVSAPAPATHLAISAPTSATAGTPFSVTVTAQDANNSTATGYTGTVHFTSSDGQAVLPANYTFTAADAGSHTFSVTLKTAGSQTITATDTATASITGSATVTVTATATSTIWSSTATPSTPDSGPDSPVEVGVKFRSDVAGSITGIRFYKGSGNTGTHIGNLWDSNGNPLATATFSGETASGWQQVNFDTPVAIQANTVYVASYHTNVGHYAYDSNYFASSGVDNPPLHALRDGVSGFDGVYAYGSTSIFPTNGWQASNYWVDVVFTDPPPGAAPSTTVAAPSATVATPSVSSPSGVADPPPIQKLSDTVPIEAVSSTSGSVAAGGSFISSVLDEGKAATWDRFFVPKKADLPPGVKLVVEARTGNTPTPDPTWSAFSVVNHGGKVPNPNARYLQYRVSLDIPPGRSLRLPIPFAIDITSTANQKAYGPKRSDQVESLPAPVPAPVLAGNPGVSPTEPFESPKVNDAGQAATWKVVSWTANLPPGATLVVEISTGNTPTPDRTWSAWSAVGNGGEVSTPARYLRLRVRVLTANSSLKMVPVNISLAKNASGVSPIQFPGSTIGNRSLDATA